MYTIIAVVYAYLNLIVFHNSEPVVLRDDTLPGYHIRNTILPHLTKTDSKVSLLLTKGSEYFIIKDKFQLFTDRFIDRDKLCAQTQLCCTPTIMMNNYQTSSSSSSVSSSSASASSLSSGVMGTSIYNHYLTAYSNLCTNRNYLLNDLLPTPYCTFNLSVSISTSPNELPKLYEIPIVICEENDHTPEFKMTASELQQINHNPRSHDNTFRTSSLHHPPILIRNVSEAAPVEYRIRLPLAFDPDAVPFNVQQYRLEENGPLQLIRDSTKSATSTFALKATSHSSDSSLIDHGEYTIDSINYGTNLPGQGMITNLELELLDQLDREKRDLYKFKILAIDGGNPARTGTLLLEVHVLDANDHRPLFKKTLYETQVEEGVADQFLLQVSATDEDIGENAVIYYDWPKGSEWIERNQSLSLSKDSLENLASRPPGYWFDLNKETGAISLKKPLDYEIKTSHVFEILAYNPTTKQTQTSGLGYLSIAARTKVVVKVINKNDEAPVILVDYLNNENRTSKHVLENSPAHYFIAFITVWDPDFNLDQNPHQFDTSVPFGPGASSVVTCHLDTHKGVYNLEENNERKRASSNPSEVLYTLSTLIPLDREKSSQDRIQISCRDSAIPPKQSLVHVLVVVDDVNDCLPTLRVHAWDSDQPTPHRSLVQPWSMQKLHNWIENYPDKTMLPHLPIFQAFLANISVYTLSVAENQIPATKFAHIEAIDLDSGVNGLVTFYLPKHSVAFNVTQSTIIQSKYSINFPSSIGFLNDPKIFDYFDVNQTSGYLYTKAIIDREAGEQLFEQIALLLIATDNGRPQPLSTYILLDVNILDRNDNPPYFAKEKFHFNIAENLPAPVVVGEIQVIDRDLQPINQLNLFEDPTKPVNNYMKNNQNRLQLRIDPGHGRRDLPFALYQNRFGRYFLNTTRVLDREMEEAFQFRLIATDNEPINSLYASHSITAHTATTLVSVNVIDVNDNHPEIIFPNPVTANSTVHRLSYRVQAGHEIVSINANDRDAGEMNGKIHYELVTHMQNQDASSGDELFTIDRNVGMLRTARVLTVNDLGEHQLQIVVSDEGEPALETYLSLRLLVDNSDPHWHYYDGQQSVVGDYSKSANTHQQASNYKQSIPNHMYKVNNYRNDLLDKFHNRATIFGPDIILFIIMAFIFALIVIMVGICFYLRHTKNYLTFIPDICNLFDRGSTTTSTANHTLGQPRIKHMTVTDKAYLQNLLDSHQPLNDAMGQYKNANDYLKSKRAINTTTTTTTTTTNINNNNNSNSNIITNNASNQHNQMKLDSFGSGTVHQHHQLCNSTNGQFFNDLHPSSPNSLMTSYFNYQLNSQTVPVKSLNSLPSANQHLSSALLHTKPRIGSHTLSRRPETALALNPPENNDELPISHDAYYQYNQNVIAATRHMSNDSRGSYQFTDNGQLHTYNVGRHPHDVNGRRIMYPNTSMTNHLPVVAKYGFRPIQECVHLYQPIDNQNSIKYGQMPEIVNNFDRTKWCVPDSEILPVYMKNNSNLCAWRSDPSLNQSTCDLIYPTKLPTMNHELFSNYQQFADDQSAPASDPKSTATLVRPMMKRSKSSKYSYYKQQPQQHYNQQSLLAAPNKLQSFNNSYYSTLCESSVKFDKFSQQALTKPLMIETNNEDREKGVTDVDTMQQPNQQRQIEANAVVSGGKQQYAVSFPTIQASFV